MPALVILNGKTEQTNQKTIKREDALDDVKPSEHKLNNGIRTVYERCCHYDREFAGASAAMKLFPDGKYTGIINADRAGKLDMIDQLVIKAELLLGADHPLIAQIAVIKPLSVSLREVLAKYAAKQKDVKMAFAKVDFARADVGKVKDTWRYFYARMS